MIKIKIDLNKKWVDNYYNVRNKETEKKNCIKWPYIPKLMLSKDYAIDFPVQGK